MTAKIKGACIFYIHLLQNSPIFILFQGLQSHLGASVLTQEDRVPCPLSLHVTDLHRASSILFPCRKPGDSLFLWQEWWEGVWRKKRGLGMGLVRKRCSLWGSEQTGSTPPSCGHRLSSQTQSCPETRSSVQREIRGCTSFWSSQTHQWEKENTGSIITQFWSTKCQ